MTTSQSQRLPGRKADLSLVAHHRNALMERLCGVGDGDGGIARDPLGDKLRLVRRIGVGGMGTVWEAEHTGLRVRVAVKRLQRELVHDEQCRLRFLREARSAASVKHPHVVEIFDVSTDDRGQPYIVMELLDGEPLSDVLRREGPMPWERARRLLAQIAAALEHAHTQGVIHRDLKPSNIVLLGSGTAHESCKIIDFGLAKQQALDPETEGLTVTGELFGSPGYMSPEQLRGEAIDARSDVYALGCIAFEMLTGRRPFGGPSVADLVAQHLTQLPPALGSFDAPRERSAAIEALVRRALGKQPGDRYPSIAVFSVELARIDERGARGWWLRGRRYGRRSMVMAGGVALTGALVLAWAQGSSGSGPSPRPSPGEVEPLAVVPSALTQGLERPIHDPTPAWPQRWLGAELGIPEPHRDTQPPSRTGMSIPEGSVGVWGSDPRSGTAYRIIAAQDDAHALSQHAVQRGLTLGHTVEDPVSAEQSGRGGDPSTGRVFWAEPAAFPLRAVGTLQVGAGCTGVQVGPVHVLTSAQCVWTEGGFALPGRRWQSGADRDDEPEVVEVVRVYVPQEWPQHDRSGLFDWAIAITGHEIGREYFGVTALPDNRLVGVSLHHKGYPIEHDAECEARSPVDWALGASRPWGNPEPLEVVERALRAPSPQSGWDRVLATIQRTSTGHAGGPYYYYDPSGRPVVVAIHRSSCSDADGGSASFCGWTGPWQCGAQSTYSSQAIRLEPHSLYGHIVPILTWWGVDESGEAVCVLEGGC